MTGGWGGYSAAEEEADNIAARAARGAKNMSESKVKFFPAPGRYLVKPDAAETVTPGGIHIPSAAEVKHERGTVVAVGGNWVNEHGTTMPAGYRLGDHILYAKYSGNEVKLDGVDHIVLAEIDVLGRFL